MKLYDFQELGVDLLTTSPRLFLADDMGTGKTIQSIWSAEALGAKKILVVCQNSMKGIVKINVKEDKLEYIGGWAEEIHKVAPKAKVGVIEGPASYRQFIAKDTGFNYYIVNYEALVGKNGILLTGILERHWDVVIFDEHHKIKNRNAKSTKACKKICKDADYVWMLSGTPLLNHAQEMWPPLNMMFPKDKKYSSYWRWVRENCDVQRGVFGWEVKDIIDPNHPRAKKLRDDLKPLMLRRTKAEVLKDMPAKTIKQAWVELHGEQLESYREMEKDMLAHFNDETITAAAVIAQIIRLKQITVGAELMFPDMEGISGAKYDALRDIIESANGTKLVVFSQFRTALERITRRLVDTRVINPRDFGMLTGSIPTFDRSITVQDFQETAYPRILFITTQAGGTGLTLTAASTAVFLDKLWTPAMNTQAQDRLHRIGQKEPVTIIELLAEDSVEKRIEDTLYRKQSLFDWLIESDEALAARGGMLSQEKMSGRELLGALYGNDLV
jgi:SNF2 family DNA or RNA helicase